MEPLSVLQPLRGWFLFNLLQFTCLEISAMRMAGLGEYVWQHSVYSYILRGILGRILGEAGCFMVERQV